MKKPSGPPLRLMKEGKLVGYRCLERDCEKEVNLYFAADPCEHMLQYHSIVVLRKIHNRLKKKWYQFWRV